MCFTKPECSSIKHKLHNYDFFISCDVKNLGGRPLSVVFPSFLPGVVVLLDPMNEYLLIYLYINKEYKNEYFVIATHDYNNYGKILLKLHRRVSRSGRDHFTGFEVNPKETHRILPSNNTHMEMCIFI